MRLKPTTSNSIRSGFTLLELIAVIAIIAILMSLILPVIQGVMWNANVVAAQSEIRQLEQALTTFETRFGTLPPSSLTIPTAGDPWSTADRSAIRAIWPQFAFATNGGLGNTSPIVLNGAECLVFFLGGVESGSVTSPVLAGFSKDPASPWMPSTNAEKFMDFDLGRMSDVDGDSLFEYLDALPDQTTPILYLSSRGKRYNETNGAGADDYDVFGTTADMSGCYFEEGGSTPHRRDSYQLISPGGDGEYGTGGQYYDGVDLSGRINERDNITNFSDGELE